MPLLPYDTVPARTERVYFTQETTFGTYVTPTNTNACRHVRCTLTPSIPMMNRRDKTGSLSITAGIKGRIYGTWEIEMDLVGNGAAGTAPDCNFLLAAAFGQLPTSSPSVVITGAAPAGSGSPVPLICSVSAVPASMQTGQQWHIVGITGTNAANGYYYVTVLSGTTFSIVLAGGSASGSYTVTGGTTASITGVVYTLSDANYVFDLWSFRNINGTYPSNVAQRVAGSCVCTSLDITFGGDFGTLTARGDCLCILDNIYFSSASAPEQGGLVSFPSEPSAPVTNGYPAAGFVGVATMESNTVAEIKTGTFTLNTGRKLIRDSFGSYVPTGVENAERTVMFNMDTDDTDSSPLAALKLAARVKTPISYSIQLGNVAGNEFIFSAANLILNPEALQDQQIRYRAAFPQALSYASTYTSKDELTLIAA